MDEVTAEDYAAVDKLLRNIDNENLRRSSLENFAYWKLGFKLYRQLELQYECSDNRAPYEAAHRALLTSVLALTEVLNARLSKIDDADLARISLSKQTFEGCARYMRRKFNQWFAPIDSSVASVFESRMARA